MSTEQDEAGIYQIDGPPYRGFAIDSNGQRIEVIYKTLRYNGTRQECQEAYVRLLNMIREELKKIQNGKVGDSLSLPIIWWRRRVAFEPDPDDKNRWCFYCRLDTTPALPNDFWDRWACPEGSLSKNAREVCA